MGKKGKKKAKLTGTPDVVRFKGTREYCLLQECKEIQESLPFVATDALDDFAYKKVARFLNMVGLLAEYLGIHSNKDYRFNFFHRLLSPTPQFFPMGFDVNVIRQAREAQERPGVTFNGVLHTYPDEIKLAAEGFLKEVDSTMTKIASEIEPRLKDDFAPGLPRFKAELKDDIELFDRLWMEFEERFVKARHEIMTKVFENVEQIITVELELTQAEERRDIEGKQRLENDFVSVVEQFTNKLFPETSSDKLPADVIPLAEACIFYESKCTEDWLHLAKHLIYEYLELRLYVMKIPEQRLSPQLKDNPQFMRHLKNFHAAVLAAREALDFVSRLPKLIHAKTSDWMTKRLLEPDLRYIQKTSALAITEGLH
ncbi:unnamed protein product [Symbiodinium sp. CCMP2592]|nr:unnamed protein product [Symbiodinium sp. CCMP2592]|mmetsp:Transcript_10127/g.24469  ORF Transcript_10127/g.24469 Transcript_10127/m.24469 type:complete len:370 (-) Transcript_10127:41-1150(-)